MSTKDDYLKIRHNLDRRYGIYHSQYHYERFKLSKAKERKIIPIFQSTKIPLAVSCRDFGSKRCYEKCQYFKLGCSHEYTESKEKIKKTINGNYVGFNKAATLIRDSFTCQWCGWKPPKAEDAFPNETRELEELLKLKIRYCEFRKSTVSVERICKTQCEPEFLHIYYDDDPYNYNYYNCPHEQRMNELKRTIADGIEAIAFRKLSAHHFCEDKTKNSISDLITLCKSCHMLYHARRKKGLSVSIAQIEVKRIKRNNI